MPNWATTRLILRGPSCDIDRFRQQCIKLSRHYDPPEMIFDLSSLIPMPPEIEAVYDDQSDVARDLAKQTTGYTGPYHWCSKYWGTKWNTTELIDRKCGNDILDIIFDTAWCPPIPVFTALASQFPELAGCVLAGEPNHEEGYLGKIADGEYSDTAIDLSHDLLLLIHCTSFASNLQSVCAKAILDVCKDEIEDFCEENDALRFIESAADLLGHRAVGNDKIDLSVLKEAIQEQYENLGEEDD